MKTTTSLFQKMMVCGFVLASLFAYATPGCTDPAACNFDATATEDDGSCTYPGCTDDTACNYAMEAGCDDGLCTYPGCTEPLATNYDPAAGCDDESCIYGGQVITVHMTDAYGDGWNGAQYSITDALSNVVAMGDLDTAMNGDSLTFGSDILSLPDGCYVFQVTGGSYPTEVQFTSTNAPGDTLFSGGAPFWPFGFSVGGASCIIEGCTNPNCYDYNPYATDSTSCSCPAPNATCEFAYAVAADTTLFGTLLGPTPPIAPDCGVPITTEGLWYSLVGTGEKYTVTTANSTSGIDSKIHVYTGSCGALECVLANDNNYPGYLSEVVFNSIEDTIYYVLVSQHNFESGMEFQLDIIASADNTIEGCTDLEASNYNPEANLNNGTCVQHNLYRLEKCSLCDATGWGNEKLTITLVGGTLPIYTEMLSSTQVVKPIGLPDGCYTFNFSGSQPNHKHFWKLIDPNQNIAAIGFGGETQVVSIGTSQPLPTCSYLFQDSPVGANTTGVLEVRISSSELRYKAWYLKDPNDSVRSGGTAGYFQDLSSCDAYYRMLIGNFRSLNVLLNQPTSFFAFTLYGVSATEQQNMPDGCYPIPGANIVSNTNPPNSHTVTPDQGCISPMPLGGNYSVGSLEGTATCTVLKQNPNGTWTEYQVNWDICLEGCTDPFACNYDPLANVNDGSCTYPGCTDIEACNYDAAAGCDDGSCCYDNCATFNMTDSFGDGWNGAAFTITALPSNVVVSSGTLAGGFAGSVDLCLETGCYELNVSAGSFPSEIGWTLNGIDGGSVSSGAPTTIQFSVGGGLCDEGCVDPSACNFDPAATIDDGSCTFPGCTDPYACNYDDEAGCNDSCIYPLCPSDFDCNGIVNVVDLLLFTSSFGCIEDCAIFDLTGDGPVTVNDLLSFLGAFGTVCL